MSWRWSKDSWTSKAFDYDKFAHMAGSAFFFCLCCFFLSPFTDKLGQIIIAFWVAMIGGITLEIYQAFDYFEDGFSWRDLVANWVGLIVAVLAVIL